MPDLKARREEVATAVSRVASSVDLDVRNRRIEVGIGRDRLSGRIEGGLREVRGVLKKEIEDVLGYDVDVVVVVDAEKHDP